MTGFSLLVEGPKDDNLQKHVPLIDSKDYVQQPNRTINIACNYAFSNFAEEKKKYYDWGIFTQIIKVVFEYVL